MHMAHAHDTKVDKYAAYSIRGCIIGPVSYKARVAGTYYLGLSQSRASGGSLLTYRVHSMGLI